MEGEEENFPCTPLQTSVLQHTGQNFAYCHPGCRETRKARVFSFSHYPSQVKGSRNKSCVTFGVFIEFIGMT